MIFHLTVGYLKKSWFDTFKQKMGVKKPPLATNSRENLDQISRLADQLRLLEKTVGKDHTSTIEVEGLNLKFVRFTPKFWTNGTTLKICGPLHFFSKKFHRISPSILRGLCSFSGRVGVHVFFLGVFVLSRSQFFWVWEWWWQNAVRQCNFRWNMLKVR